MVLQEDLRAGPRLGSLTSLLWLGAQDNDDDSGGGGPLSKETEAGIESQISEVTVRN